MDNKKGVENLRLSNEESNKLTKECLRIAIFKLMGQKAFDKITVTEIVRMSGVSRVAFYRNYGTKEALIEDLCHNVLVGLLASINGETYRNNRKQWYINFFRTIKNNSKYFEIYLKANLKISDDFVLESVFPTHCAQDHYTNAAKEGAFFSILQDWFKCGIKESPEEMGEICFNIFKSFNV